MVTMLKKLAAGCVGTHKLISAKLTTVSDNMAGCQHLGVCTGTPSPEDVKNLYSMINSVQRHFANDAIDVIDLAMLRNSFDFNDPTYSKTFYIHTLTQPSNDPTAPVETTISTFVLSFPKHYALKTSPLDGICMSYTKPQDRPGPDM